MKAGRVAARTGLDFVPVEVSMAKRQQVGKRKRFDVFKRDGFACQYCGATPPNAVMEVDHIVPVASGGGNGEANLITACFDCNRGKAANSLESIPESLASKAEIAAEKEAQLKSYEQLLRRQTRRKEKAVKDVEAVFQETFPGRQFSAAFRGSVKTFLDRMPAPKVVDSMEYACGRMVDAGADRALKYFCGICWGKIKEASHA